MKFNKTVIAAVMLTLGSTVILPSVSFAHAKDEMAHQALKQAKISFSKDKVYELAYVSGGSLRVCIYFGVSFP